jgi:hypothetical protein
LFCRRNQVAAPAKPPVPWLGYHGLGIMARLRGGGGGDGDCGCPSQCLANRLEFRE